MIVRGAFCCFVVPLVVDGLASALDEKNLNRHAALRVR